MKILCSDKNLNSQVDCFYMFVGEMCTDLVCDFDGYPAYMDGVCMCDCPTGLDSFSQPGCSAIEVEGKDCLYHLNFLQHMKCSECTFEILLCTSCLFTPSICPEGHVC